MGLSGPIKGKIYPLRHGLTLGRKADIQLDDPKTSSIHARIEQLADGTYAIIDNNSKNGIKIDGLAIPSGPLRPGTKIILGDSEFAIVGQLDPPPPPKAKYWNEILAQFFEQNRDHIVNSRRSVSPFVPCLVLEFQRGIQLNTKWMIGYGPRKVGAQSLDLPIYEPKAPAICFEIIPTPQGIVYKTAHPEIVLLNGKKVDNETLRVGDTIHIFDTVIEVDFSA